MGMMDRSSTSLQLLLQLVLLAVMLFVASEGIPEQQQQHAITLPGCPDKCGGMSIPFPFGVKPGCFLDGFQVTCNDSFQPPRLFLQFNVSGLQESSHHEVATALYDGNGFMLGSSGDNNVSTYSVLPVEVMDLSVARAEVRAYGAIRSSCFTTNSTSTDKIRGLEATRLSGPFLFAANRNVLIGVSWSIRVYLTSSVYTDTSTHLSCVSDTSREPRTATNGICSGLGCCQALLTPAAIGPSTYFGVNFEYDRPEASGGMYRTSNPCSYGMLVERSWYNFSTEDMYGYDVLPKKFPRGVPFVIDFAIRNGSCPVAGGPPPPADYACRSGNSSCANATNGPGYVCKCREHYDGNPYIPDGCQDIDECALPDQYPCSPHGICVNRLGGYDCPCKPGMKGDGKVGTCVDQFPLPAKVAVGKHSASMRDI